MRAEMEGTEGEGLGLSPLSGPDWGDGDSVSTTDVVQSGRSPWLLLGVLAVAAVVTGVLFLGPQPEDGLAVEDGEAPAEADPDPSQTNADPDPSPMLLGEPTNLGLVIGSRAQNLRTPPRLLVLDTGELVELKGVSGEVHGVVDGRLVVGGETYEGAAPAVVDLRQPSLPVEPLAAAEPENADDWSDTVWDISDGLVWAVSAPGQSEEMVLKAINADGEVVLTEALPLVMEDGIPFADLYRESRVLHEPDGAIYRDTGDGYERVGFGALEASTADAVLVAECDRSKDCAAVWRDRETWDLLPYPSVDTEELWRARSAPGGRMELWDAPAGPIELGDPTYRVIDIVSGDVVLEDLDGANFASGFSPDGRWVAYFENGDFVVLDLATDTAWPISDEGREDPLTAFHPSVTLVDLAGTVFAGS